jgi:hypothetical protein
LAAGSPPGACLANGDTCKFATLQSGAPPTETFVDGPALYYQIQCAAVGEIGVSLDSVSLGGIDGVPIASCGGAAILTCEDPALCDGVECADEDPCTVDDCDATTGACVFSALPNGSNCDDADNDGLEALEDPCPFDARNRCFGAVAVDGTTGKPIRVNANVSTAECSGDKTDCKGEVWAADFGYNQPEKATTCDLNGGGESCVVSGIDDIFGCEDESTEDLFQCEHTDRNPDPDLIYHFDVADGAYLVNLFFANTYTGTTAVGARLFDIKVGATTVYANFDQVLAAGGSARAVVRSAVAIVSGGLGLDVQFVNLPKNNPAIKAIEVLTAGGGATTTTTTSTTSTTTTSTTSAPTTSTTTTTTVTLPPPSTTTSTTTTVTLLQPSTQA